MSQLTTSNHDRDVVGMTYVYPVVSRRAGGVSIGINLNPNHACNWQCVYCQVPNLVRGSAPKIDRLLLHHELQEMLNDIVFGSFMQQRVPEDCRVLCDIAISGNGEPTSCRDFDKIVALIIEVMQAFDLSKQVKLRLISNGSYMHKPYVQRALALMAQSQGEVWVKVDALTDEAIQRINGVSASADILFKQVENCAKLCPTWLQTCMLEWQGKAPSDEEVTAYLSFLRSLQQQNIPIQGVLLYGLARPSQQAAAASIATLDKAWMHTIKESIEAIGFAVKLSL